MSSNKEDVFGFTKLTDDLKTGARTLDREQARFLVDYYYQMQDNRISAKNQDRGSEQEPSEWIGYVGGHLARLEGRIQTALDIYSNEQELGRWSRSNIGIGPVIAAGLLAHIDIKKTFHAGSLQRYAGLDPTIEWISAIKAKSLVGEVLPARSGLVTSDHLVQLAKLTNRTPKKIKEFALLVKNGSKPTKSDGEMGFNRQDLIKGLARRP